MSFRDDCYYVIHPKDSLLRRLAERPTDGGELLTEPQVWRRGESSHDNSLPEHRLAYIKVMFLAWLHHDYLAKLENSVRDQFHIHLEEMLGSEPFTPVVFDQWWKIERIEDSTALEDVERRIGIESIYKIDAPAIDYVKRQLHDLIEKKADDGNATA